MPRQASAVGRGGLHTDRLDTTEVLQPAQQLLVTLTGGGKGLIAQSPTLAVQCDGMMPLLVAIHATDDVRLGVLHTGPVVSFVSGTPVSSGRTEQ